MAVALVELFDWSVSVSALPVMLSAVILPAVVLSAVMLSAVMLSWSS